MSALIVIRDGTVAERATESAEGKPCQLAGSDLDRILRREQVEVAHTKGLSQFKDSQNGRVAFAAFKIADILLRQAGALGKLFLRPATRFTQPGAVVSNKLAHVHAQSIGEAAQVSLSTIVCKRLMRDWCSISTRF